MKINEIERIQELIQKAELEQAKSQGVKDNIKSEWKKKYGFETIEEAKEKLEELKTELMNLNIHYIGNNKRVVIDKNLNNEKSIIFLLLVGDRIDNKKLTWAECVFLQRSYVEARFPV